MSALIAKLVLVLPVILKTLGSILLSMVMSLLTGKTFKTLILWPFQWLASKTVNKKDDELVEKAKQDLDI